MTLPIQDLAIIVGATVGPMGTLMGLMWHHSNKKFESIDQKFDAIQKELFGIHKELTERINAVEKQLSTKIDTVEEKLSTKVDTVEKKLDNPRDCVILIEGQLVAAKIVAFGEVWPR